MDLQNEITQHDLNLLSIGHYIHGAIVGFYALFGLAYMGLIGVIFGRVLKNAPTMENSQIPPNVQGIIGVLFGGLLFLMCLYVVGIFLAGYWLRQRRNMVFIQIIAVVNCLLIPYGTVLGVFTFIVLGKPHAKQIFGCTVPVPFAVAQNDSASAT